MTTDPEAPYADPGDVAEQHQDVIPPADDEEAPDLEPDEVPLEADEADVVEQLSEVSGSADEDDGDA